MHEVRKPHGQDLRSDKAWSINSREIQSSPGDFPGSRWMRALASSSGVKEPKMLFPQVLGHSIS